MCRSIVSLIERIASAKLDKGELTTVLIYLGLRGRLHCDLLQSLEDCLGHVVSVSIFHQWNHSDARNL